MLRAGFNSVPTFTPLSLPGFKEPVTAIPFAVHYGAYSAYSSKRFTLTNDKFGFHGYPNSWWWHNVEFNLIVPFPDAVPEKTCGVLRCLKLDSQIWAIDRENVLPGLKDGLQDAEFGLALPLILDLGGGSASTGACGVSSGSRRSSPSRSSATPSTRRTSTPRPAPGPARTRSSAAWRWSTRSDRATGSNP